FFFSSRRRHTRFSRDWSSDVCSSDLKVFKSRIRREELEKLAEEVGAEIVYLPRGELDEEQAAGGGGGRRHGGGRGRRRKGGQDRSEERRVGKECGARWAPEQEGGIET